MSWYGQRAAGFWKADPSTVHLLERGHGLFYTDDVLYEVDEILATGFQGWIAPEGHVAREKPKEQWVWKYANTNHMLEAVYAEDFDIGELERIAKINKGMGWRFPKIFIFQRYPASHYLTTMRGCGVPWGIEQELRKTVLEPPPNEDWKTDVRDKIESMGHTAREILDIIETV